MLRVRKSRAFHGLRRRKPALDDDDLEFLPLGISTVVDGNAARRCAIQVNNPQARQLARATRPVLIAESGVRPANLRRFDDRRADSGSRLLVKSPAILGTFNRQASQAARKDASDEKPDSSHPVDQLRARLASAIERPAAETSQRYAVEAARRIENRRAGGHQSDRRCGSTCATVFDRRAATGILPRRWPTFGKPIGKNGRNSIFRFPTCRQFPRGTLRCLTADQKRVWHSLQNIDLPAFFDRSYNWGTTRAWDEPEVDRRSGLRDNGRAIGINRCSVVLSISARKQTSNSQDLA